jgi:hypothetical protein
MLYVRTTVKINVARKAPTTKTFVPVRRANVFLFLGKWPSVSRPFTELI